jgi:hypothetical protein
MPDIPEDVFIVFNDDRQLAEAEALKLMAPLVPAGFVPQILFHDIPNKILIISEVCGDKGQLYADVINESINPDHAVILSRNIAQVSNGTFGKFTPLRPENLETEIRRVKAKYEVTEVWHRITPADLRQQLQKIADNFSEQMLSVRSVLVHGDYYDRNIRINGPECATFDLEESHWGDVAEDIGKLIGSSYLLRAIYFPAVCETAIAAATAGLTEFFKTLKITEDHADVEKKIRVMMAGCMMMRIDGISSTWLPWVHDAVKQEKTRKLAAQLLLDSDHDVIETITDFLA